MSIRPVYCSVNLQTEKMKAENMIANGYAGLKLLLMGMPVSDSLMRTDTLTTTRKEGVLESSQYNYNDRKEYQVMTITK